MGEIVEFDWMWRDEIYAHVRINRKTGEVLCEEYQDDVFLQFLGKRPHTIEYVMKVFESRLFDRHRPDCDEMCDYWGVNGYNPYELCPKTHGVNTDDFSWIKWEGETLTWNDVKVRQD